MASTGGIVEGMSVLIAGGIRGGAGTDGVDGPEFWRLAGVGDRGGTSGCGPRKMGRKTGSVFGRASAVSPVARTASAITTR